MKIEKADINRIRKTVKLLNGITLRAKKRGNKQYLTFYWRESNPNKIVEVKAVVDEYTTGYQVCSAGTFDCTILTNPDDVIVIAGTSKIANAAHIAGLNYDVVQLIQLVENTTREEASFQFPDKESALQFRLMVDG